MAADVALKHAAPKHKVADDSRRRSLFPLHAMLEEYAAAAPDHQAVSSVVEAVKQELEGYALKPAALEHKANREVVLKAMKRIERAAPQHAAPEHNAKRPAVVRCSLRDKANAEFVLLKYMLNLFWQACFVVKRATQDHKAVSLQQKGIPISAAGDGYSDSSKLRRGAQPCSRKAQGGRCDRARCSEAAAERNTNENR